MWAQRQPPIESAAAAVAGLSLAASPGDARADVVGVHPGDERDADPLRTGRLALAMVRAGTEARRVHRRHHAERALEALGLALREERKLTDLRGREEHRRGVRAGGDAG